MDIGRILIAGIGIPYLVYKIFKERKKEYFFWAILLLYSVTSFGFIVDKERYSSIMAIQSNAVVMTINYTLAIAFVALGVNIMCTRFKKIKRKRTTS